ncbi:MAG: YgaP family membrane protein [Saezia sp.]
MKKNVGGLDRILRIVIGAVLIGLTLSHVIGWWGWIGVIPFATALIGWCPLYMPLGMNTADKSKCSSDGNSKRP